MRKASLLLLCLTAGSLVAEDPKPVLVVKPDAFQTLVNPKCSHCRDEAKRRAGDLRDNDRVLCWIRGKYDGGAIPIRFFLNPYRVISDTYGTFVYDPDAGYARAFPASLDYRRHGHEAQRWHAVLLSFGPGVRWPEKGAKAAVLADGGRRLGLVHEKLFQW